LIVQKRIAFDELLTADLTVGAVYEGGTRGNAADDPLARLLPVGNQGGFRFTGRPKLNEYRLAVLYTSGAEADWPDVLDPETGAFTYFGDNRRPGNELHATRRGGNQLLRFAFDALHGAPSHRDLVPPFFIFSKMAGDGRAVEFAGLAVPGAKDVTPTGDLVAVWRTTAGQRFQNYRATFTVLDRASVPRAWIEEVLAGDALGAHCPSVFRAWVQKGTYTPLESPRTTEIRTIDDQRPQGGDAALVAAVYEYFEDGYAFELCAMELWRMLAKDSVSQMSGTRAVVDGGRDAVGLYSLGPAGDRVHLDFSLEAKRYAPTSSCGVKDLARLISRLRHRQFGVFVTTSYVGKQAYTELREDRHPVVVICGRDIAAILKEHGYATPAAVTAWLSAQFPPSVSPAP
jgi:hypothetical protein